MTVRVWLLLQCNQRALHRLTCWFSYALENLVEVGKGSQICMIIGTEGNKRHLKRKVDEGGVRRKWQLRRWYGRQEEHITYIPQRGDCLYRQLLW